MKKLGLALIISLTILVLGASLCACTTNAVWHGITKMSIKSQTDYSVSLSCDYFKGSVTYSIKTKEGHSDAIKAHIVVEEGSLDVVIKDKDGKELYNEKLTEAKDFEIKLEYVGRYKISLKADEYKGEYKFDWE